MRALRMTGTFCGAGAQVYKKKKTPPGVFLCFMEHMVFFNTLDDEDNGCGKRGGNKSGTGDQHGFFSFRSFCFALD